MSNIYEPEKCTCCGQSKTYIVGLDKGSAKIVLAILDTVAKKGENSVHPARELALEPKDKWFLTNLSRPRFHGLIAKIDGKKGYYCLTRKAGAFLRGESVPKNAIISKVSGHQEGYFNEEEERVTIGDLLKSSITWEGDKIDAMQMIDPVF